MWWLSPQHIRTWTAKYIASFFDTVTYWKSTTIFLDLLRRCLSWPTKLLFFPSFQKKRWKVYCSAGPKLSSPTEQHVSDSKDAHVPTTIMSTARHKGALWVPFSSISWFMLSYHLLFDEVFLYSYMLMTSLNSLQDSITSVKQRLPLTSYTQNANHIIIAAGQQDPNLFNSKTWPRAAAITLTALNMSHILLTHDTMHPQYTCPPPGCPTTLNIHDD